MTTKKPKTEEAVLDVALLQAIATATAGAEGYMNVPQADAVALGGLVEINPDPAFADAASSPAVRVSAAGLAHLDTPAPAATAATEPAEKAKFAIVAFDIPAASRKGGARPEIYPFSSLEVGQAFFIPTTAAKPDPAKAYASTVASASLRYATEDTSQPQAMNRKNRMAHPMKYERKFSIRAVADGAAFGHPGVAGAAVGRVI